MSQAITRCPACSTSFRITEQQLLAADGSVRCGACMHLFQAEDYFISPMLDVTELLAIEADYWLDFESYIAQVVLSDGKKDSSEISEPEVESPVVLTEPQVVRPDSVVEFADRKVSFSGLVQFTEPVPLQAQKPSEVSFWEPEAKDWDHVVDFWEPDEEVSLRWQDCELSEPVRLWQPENEKSEAVEDESIPEPELTAESPEPLLTSVFLADDQIQPIAEVDFDVEDDPTLALEDKRRIISFHSIKWIPGIAVMLALVFAQYAYMQMPTYAQDIRYRPYYEESCYYLGCVVPEYYNPSELLTRELVVRSHPSADDGLVADVLLRNAADYRQQFPELRLKFFDINGEVVASRVFRVNEYLGGEMRGLKFIPGRTEVRLSLEIVDPGDQALGYQMDVVSFAPSF